ncbi:MAG: hypothetical protein F6K09_35370 [Merismopedia sp. SIO2A8]|nr:hypothetical protein [Merismopedia sp. SIO2A8]
MIIQDLNHLETVQGDVRGSVSAYSHADGLIDGKGVVSTYTSSRATRRYGRRSAYSRSGASARGYGILAVSSGSGAYA